MKKCHHKIINIYKVDYQNICIKVINKGNVLQKSAF